MDTSVQGLATPGLPRPLPLPPCKEAAPEHEAPGFKEKEGLKASRWETKTQWRGQRPCQRQTQRPRQSVEAGKWLWGAVWENREAFEAGSQQGVSRAQSRLGQLLEEGPGKGHYCSIPRQAVLHECPTRACRHEGHSQRHTGDSRTYLSCWDWGCQESCLHRRFNVFLFLLLLRATQAGCLITIQGPSLLICTQDLLQLCLGRHRSQEFGAS